MNVLVIEDESFAAKRLVKMIAEILPEATISAPLKSVKESIAWLMKNTPDLIFMDIQLSDGVSFNIFEQIDIQTPVIFTTAYDQYAIKAFEANSLGYILKPVQRKNLEKAVAKYKHFYHGQKVDLKEVWQQIKSGQDVYKQRFLVQRGEKLVYIKTADIAFFYAIQKDVYANTFEGKTYAMDSSLESINDKIDPAVFFRINRKFVINIGAIESMIARSRGRVKVNLNPPADDPEEAVVSVERAADFKKWLNR
ncbi:LytR/AlgR family response regulator transcription factor [Salinivirga cyanobacteriivorans]